MKICNVILLIVLVFTLQAGCAQPPAPSTSLPPTVPIGAFIGLNGDIAVYGASQKNGIDLAVKEINSSDYLGTGIDIKVIIEDTGAFTDGAVAAINKLISDDKVLGIIGPTLSAQAFAADPLAQKNGIPVIGISNTVSKFTEMGDFIFRCSMPESTVIDGTIKAAFDMYSLKKAGVIWQKDDDYTIGAYESFRNALRKNGINLLSDETFIRGATDFKTQLSSIIAVQPDALIISAFAKEAAAILIQARSLNFKNVAIGGNGLNTVSTINLAGKDAEGVVAGTAWNMASTAPRNMAFISAFEKAYGSKPDQFAAQAYTGVWLYANAIKVANSADPKAIRDALAKIRDFDTPLGKFSFTEDRNPVHPCAVQIVRDGTFVILDKNTATVKPDISSGKDGKGSETGNTPP